MSPCPDCEVNARMLAQQTDLAREAEIDLDEWKRRYEELLKARLNLTDDAAITADRAWAALAVAHARDEVRKGGKYNEWKRRAEEAEKQLAQDFRDAGNKSIDELLAERNEWERRAVKAETERDALATQVAAMREALDCYESYCRSDLESCDGNALPTVDAALALDTTRAERIAEARRQVCETVAEFFGAPPEVDVEIDCLEAVRTALAALREAEGGKR